MPLIKVQTSISKPESKQVDSLLKTLSAKLAKHLGKPESYVMTAFEGEIPMTFAGTTDPVCYIEVKSIGNMTAAQTKAMSQDFCTIVENELGVAAKRTYIEFANAQGSLWGWNGGTF
jgi:phenylpyruvate tautomerase PptA (4-oxalocrotonate tautomerase family)